MEERWLVDPRRDLLSEKLKDRDLADGVAIRFWRLAQDYDDGIVPTNLFTASKYFQEFLDCDLARKVDGGCYVCGSIEFHNWMKKKKIAGRLGGIAKAIKSKQILAQPSTCQDLPTSARIALPSVSSSSSSSSSSSQRKNKYIGSKNIISVGKKIINTIPFDQFWNAYEHRNGAKKGRIKAAELWVLIQPEEAKKALQELEKQKKQYKNKKAVGEFTPEFPDAHRWIKEKRWEDEIEMKVEKISTPHEMKFPGPIQWEKS